MMVRGRFVLFFSLFLLLCWARPRARGAEPPDSFYIHHCIDNGGLKDLRTGRFLEVFSMMIPSGWRFTGGVRWVLAGGNPAGATRADLLFPVRSAWIVSSPDGRYVLRAYPEVYWVDPSSSPAARMGLMPAPGSALNGMTVSRVMDPLQYILSYVIPYQRGQLTGGRLVEKRERPDLCEKYRAEAESLNRVLGLSSLGAVSFRGASLTTEYPEGKAVFREGFAVVLQYVRVPGSTMWWPRMNISLRAPAGDYEKFLPLFISMLASIKINTRWLVRLQMLINHNQAGVAEVDSWCRRLDNEINKSRSITNAKIFRQVRPNLVPWHEHRAPDGSIYYLDPSKKHSINPETGQVQSGNKYLTGHGWKKLNVLVK